MLCVVLVILLILVAGMRPEPHTMSTSELERRKAKGDKSAAAILRREALLPSVVAILQIVTALLLVMLAYIFVVMFGWLWGVVAALVVAIEYASIARLKAVKRLALRLYVRYETMLLKMASYYKNSALRFIQNAEAPRHTTFRIDSVEELTQLITYSDALPAADKTFAVHALAFRSKKVSDIMTPKKQVQVVQKSELLGPLVLSDLHKTGHEAFPVTSDTSLDSTVGILSIEQLLTVDSGKKSTTAEKMMDSRIVSVKDSASVQTALDLFVTTHVRMIIVTNEDGAVGILTLTDVVQTITGKQND